MIVSQELDPTADEVVLALGERGVPVFRIDRAWFPQRLTLAAELRDGRWAGCLHTADRRVELDDIQSVWYRWRSQFVLSPRLSPPDRQHAEREARAGFDGVVCSLDVRHVNHADRVAALPKPAELHLAVRCGLDVPQTVISNSSRQVSEFVKDSRGAVRKLFSCHVFDDTGRSMFMVMRQHDNPDDGPALPWQPELPLDRQRTTTTPAEPPSVVEFLRSVMSTTQLRRRYLFNEQNCQPTAVTLTAADGSCCDVELTPDNTGTRTVREVWTHAVMGGGRTRLPTMVRLGRIRLGQSRYHGNTEILDGVGRRAAQHYL